MPTFFVEQLANPVALQDLRDDLRRILAALDPAFGSGAVRWLSTTYVPARGAGLSLVQAPDADTVLRVLASVGVRAAAEPAVILHPLAAEPQ
jgi:hypothetical protein